LAKVKKIRLRQIMGVEELEFEPGAVTVIEGANGQGKTSVLEAVRAALGGGYDATLVRAGADAGEVVLVMDDEVEVTKRIRATGGGDVQVRHPDFGKVSAPQAYLSGITDVLGPNPVTLLTAAPKDRVRLFLEALPITAPQEQLAAAVEGTGLQVPDLSDRHAVEAIEAVRKRVFDERTGVNRVAKEQRTTAEQLAASLPEDFESATVLENRLRDLEGAHRDADRELQRQLAGLEAEKERALGKIREKRDAEVRRLTDEIRRVEREAEQNLTLAGAECDERKENLMLEGRPQVNQLGQRATELREQLKAADRYENTRRMLRDARAKAEQHEGQAETLTAALGRLDALRDRLMADLPIAEVTIQDGEVHVGGVPWPRVNTARRVRVCIEVARLRAGKLPLICVDQLECLDRETFDAFLAQLEARNDLQAVVTRVTEGPLTVRTAAAVGA
jgi:hypothetical protein